MSSCIYWSDGLLDYYPFGMLVPNRHESSKEYRYGFNGKELDNELKGEGNSYDFGARIYDPRIGKFLSLDPMQDKFAYISPYSYAENKPTTHIDQDGKYALFIHYMLTRYKLIKAGMSQVVASLVAHYSSTFTDNPASRSSNNQGDLLGRLIVNKNSKDSQGSNPIFSAIGGSLSSREAKGILYNKGINYDRTEESQSENPTAQKWHSTRTLYESNTVTAADAINRSLSNAWDLLFDSANLSSIEAMQANTVAIENLGMSLHTFQDVQAHKGAVFRSVWLNGWGYYSTWGNEHDLDNDMNPGSKAFRQAAFATESAITIHQILNGKFKGLKNGQRIYTEGMSQVQKDELNSALNKGGYELTNIERKDVSRIDKKKKR
ncbi:RHS repeat domain-containing protein [Flavobacterium sp. LC2016-23]|uniref:RHS repeat domain-containing protein n=1 Tax=Flavobacterium sp. LC2016-23 TaxID=2666330 RepID=UPI0018A1D53F|nr:RHS repeat-associated core domain-containing protein [Flavobacterium sp. LC2016-23]